MTNLQELLLKPVWQMTGEEGFLEMCRRKKNKSGRLPRHLFIYIILNISKLDSILFLNRYPFRYLFITCSVIVYKTDWTAFFRLLGLAQ